MQVAFAADTNIESQRSLRTRHNIPFVRESIQQLQQHIKQHQSLHIDACYVVIDNYQQTPIETVVKTHLSFFNLLRQQTSTHMLVIELDHSIHQ